MCSLFGLVMNSLDRRLVELCAKGFLQQTNIRVRQNRCSRRRELLSPQAFASRMGRFRLRLSHFDSGRQRLFKITAQLLLNTLHMRIVEEGGMAAIEYKRQAGAVALAQLAMRSNRPEHPAKAKYIKALGPDPAIERTEQHLVGKWRNLRDNRLRRTRLRCNSFRRNWRRRIRSLQGFSCTWLRGGR